MLKFRFTSDGKEIGGFDIKVLELEPGKRVLWQVVEGPPEWIGTKINFELKQEDDYSIVLFEHQGWKEPVEFMYHCSTKWAIFLMSLKSLVETAKANRALTTSRLATGTEERYVVDNPPKGEPTHEEAVTLIGARCNRRLYRGAGSPGQHTHREGEGRGLETAF